MARLLLLSRFPIICLHVPNASHQINGATAPSNSIENGLSVLRSVTNDLPSRTTTTGKRAIIMGSINSNALCRPSAPGSSSGGKLNTCGWKTNNSRRKGADVGRRDVFLDNKTENSAPARFAGHPLSYSLEKFLACLHCVLIFQMNRLRGVGVRR